jgi:hypothetical protein
VDRGGPLPLSFAQQRLWFLEQLGGLGGTYHIPMRLRLRGSWTARRCGARWTDRGAPRGAAHHLREVDGEPVQRIAEESRFPCWSTTWAGHAGAEAELRRLARRRRGAPSTWSAGR